MLTNNDGICIIHTASSGNWIRFNLFIQIFSRPTKRQKTVICGDESLKMEMEEQSIITHTDPKMLGSDIDIVHISKHKFEHNDSNNSNAIIVSLSDFKSSIYKSVELCPLDVSNGCSAVELQVETTRWFLEAACQRAICSLARSFVSTNKDSDTLRDQLSGSIMNKVILSVCCSYCQSVLCQLDVKSEDSNGYISVYEKKQICSNCITPQDKREYELYFLNEEGSADIIVNNYSIDLKHMIIVIHVSVEIVVLNEEITNSVRSETTKMDFNECSGRDSSRGYYSKVLLAERFHKNLISDASRYPLYRYISF